jgi:hypothetical protein
MSSPELTLVLSQLILYGTFLKNGEYEFDLPGGGQECQHSSQYSKLLFE